MSQKYLGGYLADTTSFSYPASGDPQFNYVTALLHGDGTNGAQNNTFLDSSTNNFTITRNGNTTQGTFSPFGSLWSNYFDGTSNSYLSAPDNAVFNLYGSSFTIEGWVFPTRTYNNAQSGFRNIISKRTPSGASSSWNIQLWYNSNKIGFYNGTVYLSASELSLNTWTHFAYTCDGASTLKLWINGVLDSTFTASAAANNSDSVKIGSHVDDTGTYNNFGGYISNIRVVKGSQLYTATFTPSTTPLTAVSGTSLLTCRSNRFIDNSTNAFTITATGSPSVQRFSPFNTSTAYSTSVIGGSGYFDGAGDYLTTPTTGQFAPTGDFTISLWVYPTALNASNLPLGNYTSNTSTDWGIEFLSNGTINLYTNGATVRIQSTTGLITTNVWHHISMSRSGTTITGYLNGVSFGTYTQSGTFGSATKTIYIGCQAGSTEFVVGYISNVKLIDGIAVTTVPTAPQTATTGTSLLLNFTNAGIYDNAMMNGLETVGNAQISTSVYKYGTGSMYFNGSTGKLVGPTSPNLNMGSGDFTVECWMYWGGTSTLYQNFMGSNSASFAGNATFFRVWGTSAGGGLANKVGIGNPTHDATSSVYSVNNLAANTWTHVAATRSSGIIRVFINGTLERTGSSDTSTYDFGDNGICVGQSPWDGANGWYSGYIDDLRITKGYARYTANFTPPTAAFPDNYTPAVTTSIVPTATSAPGIWTMDQQAFYKKQGLWPIAPIVVQYLVVAGGGGGGGSNGGGGGAGGLLTSTGFTVTQGSALTVTVGAGGSGGVGTGTDGTNGSNSVFSSITAIGGGRGGTEAATDTGANGGSGGGGNGYGLSAGTKAGGTGVSSQGFAGGLGSPRSTGYPSGGGGGSSAVGADYSAGQAGNGGAGTSSSITGTATTYAGGGGGGCYTGSSPGTGGTGGGGDGARNTAGVAGTTNLGGGGGGGGNSANGAAGGSGVVIISSVVAAASTTGSPTVTTSGGNTIYTFTSSGTITF